MMVDPLHEHTECRYGYQRIETARGYRLRIVISDSNILPAVARREYQLKQIFEIADA